MIGSLPKEETLYLTIARGTDVMAKHDEFLVELCSSNGMSDKEVEGSITNYLAEGYYDDTQETNDNIGAANDSEGEQMMDNMFNMWAEELPPPPTFSEGMEQPKETAEKIKPWSSRSSPSGTFVRDPVTGEMKNIDSTDWANGMGDSGGSSS